MQNIAAVLTDLDGTILYPNGDSSYASKQVVQRLAQRGIPVMPVTGRSYRSSSELCKQIGFDGMGVFSGGALIVDIPTGNVLWEQPIEESLARSLLKEISEFSEYLSFGYGRVASEEIVTMTTNNPYYLSVWVEAKHHNLESILNVVQKLGGLTAHTNATLTNGCVGIQINSREANKLFGARQLLKLANIHSSRVLAIGDDNNDIPLFKAVGVGVAMGNGSKELKQVADYVTTSIDEDGFKYAMTKYVLNSSV